jgi:hypothetical protein
MSELFDPRHLACFAPPSGPIYGAFHTKPSELTFGSSQPRSGTLPKGGVSWFYWKAEKTHPIERKMKGEVFFSFADWVVEGLDTSKEIVEGLEVGEEEAESPLDRSTVAKYHELSTLHAQGRLSPEQKAELVEVQRQLDAQEQAYAQDRSLSSELDDDIEKLKNMIEINRMVTSML